MVTTRVLWPSMAIFGLAGMPIAWAAGEPIRVASCNTDADDPNVVVVDATVVDIRQPAYRCAGGDASPGFSIDEAMSLLDAIEGASARPTAETGCVLVIDGPACSKRIKLEMVGGSARAEDEDPPDVEVRIDGAARRARFVTGMWRACELPPGTHALTMCSDGGPVVCPASVAAGATALVSVPPVAPSALLRVDHSYRDRVSSGASVTVELAEPAAGYRVELPAHAIFTWRTNDPHRRASLCSAPAESPPVVQGCARCDARSNGSAGWLITSAAITFLVTRRRR
jgi:hypothetical protein